MDEKEIQKIAESIKAELKRGGLQTIAASKLQSSYNIRSSSNCPPVCPCDPVCPCSPMLICPPIGRIDPPSGEGRECIIVCPLITPVPEYSEFKEKIRDLQNEFDQKYQEIMDDFRLTQETKIDLQDLEKISRLPDDAFKTVKEILERLRKSNKEKTS